MGLILMEKIFAFILLLSLGSCHHNSISPSELPSCIDGKISEIESEELDDRKVFTFLYKDARVYYVSARCCDFPSELYDLNCNVICYPDGGFTGSGDGKCRDLPDQKKWTLVWERKEQ